MLKKHFVENHPGDHKLIKKLQPCRIYQISIPAEYSLLLVGKQGIFAFGFPTGRRRTVFRILG